MPRNRPLLLAIALVASVALAAGPWANQAHASLCADIPSVAKSLEDSDAVFSGEVLRGSENLDPGDDDVWVHAEIRVDRSWKGLSSDSAEVYSQDPAYSSLGYRFEQGRDYLVYATRYGDGFRVEDCGRTTTLAGAGKDLRALGPPERLTDTGGPSPSTFVTLATVAAFLVSAGLMTRWACSRDAGHEKA